MLSPFWNESELNAVRRKYDTGPVLDLFTLFVQNSGKAIRTQEAEADGMHLLLDAVLAGGLRWKPHEAEAIQRVFGIEHGKYRFRIDEAAYTTAVSVGNESACKSIENYLERAPWFWNDRIQATTRTRGTGKGTGARIAVGFRVWLEPSWWEVTSMHADRITLCARDVPSKASARKTLTREQVAATFNTEVPV